MQAPPCASSPATNSPCPPQRSMWQLLMRQKSECDGGLAAPEATISMPLPRKPVMNRFWSVAYDNMLIAGGLLLGPYHVMESTVGPSPGCQLERDSSVRSRTVHEEFSLSGRGLLLFAGMTSDLSAGNTSVVCQFMPAPKSVTVRSR